VEQHISKPLAGVLSTVPGVQHIHSFSRQGQSIISMQFKWGQDMDLAYLNVRQKLDQVAFLLPEQAGAPQLVHNSSADQPIAILGITTANQNRNTFATRLSLKRWVKEVLARRLEETKGIAQAVLVGGVVPEVKIRYRPKAISRYGLSLTGVQSRLQQANLFTAAGQLRNGWYRYSLKIQSRINSLDDIRKVPVAKLGKGKILTLADVAQVQMAPADPTSFALAGGQPVLSVLVKKAYGTNTVKVYHAMLPVLKQLRRQNPDVHIQVLSENASYISSTIHNLMESLVLGAFLAFIVLFLFLDDYRTPFTIGIAIPTSICLTFFVMFITGIQLNIISLSGLTLATGMLVDNAIIVLDNINRYRGLGYGIFEAASKGTREVILAVTASTFTHIAVFLPLIFLSGLQGAFFKDQAWTISISLLASLLVAMFILPVLMVQVLKRFRRGRSLGFSTYFERIRDDGYIRSLIKSLPYEKWYIGLVILLGGFAGWEFLMLGKSVLPQTTPQQVRYRIRLPGNTALPSTRGAATALSSRLPHKANHPIQILGGYTDQTNLSALTKEGPNIFTVTVPVSSSRQAARVQKEVNAFVGKRPGWSARPLGDNTTLTMLLNASTPPVIFRLVGKNRRRSARLASLFQSTLKRADSSVTLQKQYRQQLQTYKLHFKAARLLQLGLTENDVIGYLKSLTSGKMITNWDRQDENVAIRLVGYGRTIYDPHTIRLHLKGKIIPLTDVATVTKGSEPRQLERVDQTPVLSYTSNLGFGGWWWNQKKIRKAAQEFTRQTGIQVKIGGSMLTIASLLKQMGLLLLFSVFVIYIILAIEFEDLKHPFIIILAVPFAWIGALTMLWLTGSSLNVFSFMGILILTGISVNDAILKVDFMKRYYAESGDLVGAIAQSAHARFRPVMMTTITTMLGVVPLLLPLGPGYAYRQSLALALIGGMITSPVMTLYIVPMVYQWIERREWMMGKTSKKQLP
jgi:HAE1 family hydrophobic/amphiphilic exporter-1